MDIDTISCRGRVLHVCVCAAEIHQDCWECVHSVEIKSLTGHLHSTHIHTLGMDVSVWVCMHTLRRGQRHTCMSTKGRQMSTGYSTPNGSGKEEKARLR